MISDCLKSICNYDEYLSAQRDRNQKAREIEETDENLDMYTSKKLRQIIIPQQYSEELKNLKTVLESTDVLIPVNISDHIKCNSRNSLYLLMKSIKEKGVLSMVGYDIYYYYLPSKGPHPAFIFYLEGCRFHRRRGGGKRQACR